MPNRVIRGDLLDSGKYWGVGIEARQLFLHLLLVADDFGCVSLAPIFIRRRCFDDAPSNEKINSFLEQLIDKDLIRVYEVDRARFGFIPRFRQRLQRMTLKHPPPPEKLLSGDDDAIQKFRKINGLRFDSTVGQQIPNGFPSTEVKRSEGKGREGEGEGKSGAPIKSAQEWAQELGIERKPGEGEGSFQIRVASEVARLKKGQRNEFQA